MRGRSTPKPKRKRPARLPEKLLEIRVKLDLSQGGMVKKLGMDDVMERDYISKYERGVLEPPLHILCAYADLANVTLDVLARDYLDLPDSIPARHKHSGVPVKTQSAQKIKQDIKR